MSECPCVELRATNPTPTLTECAPCVSLRCPDDQLTQDQRTDLWNTRQCATAECPDHTGQVERCVNAGAFGTTLFNVTQEQIDDAQAALNAAALAEAQRLANAALNCPPGNVCATCASELGPDWATQNAYDAPLADGIYVEDSEVCAQIEHFGTEAAAQAAAEARFQELWLNGDIQCCSCAGDGVVQNISDLLWFGSITYEPLEGGSTNSGCSFAYIQMASDSEGAHGSFEMTTGNESLCFFGAGAPDTSGGFCTLVPVKITYTVNVAIGGFGGGLAVRQCDGCTYEGGTTNYYPDGFGGEYAERELTFSGPGTYTIVAHMPACSTSNFLIQLGGIMTGTITIIQEAE